ncbi:hypothetical protein HK107_07615 [Parvularcula sp. ZS-1/3]|uniref:Uncharacterized protein n=1 Tax=Parvularcula mediterranea TaxID=2732508 RepID=A0A7Y3RM84_9PROT|nr:hypothetical protein [Parvularcula mediterranea]NNU16185.1 hypothetical protein [Parvularcula mediterranea]
MFVRTLIQIAVWGYGLWAAVTVITDHRFAQAKRRCIADIMPAPDHFVGIVLPAAIVVITLVTSLIFWSRLHIGWKIAWSPLWFFSISIIVVFAGLGPLFATQTFGPGDSSIASEMRACLEMITR